MSGTQYKGRASIGKLERYLIAIASLVALPTMATNAQSVDAENTTELEEVVVDSKSEDSSEPVAKQPLGIGISGQTLRNTPGSAGDPLRTLQSLPGMVFADDESAEPAVRGSRPGDNIFEVDFLPAGYLYHVGGVVSVFNSELVEAFDIYPAAYGPEFFSATGGVFDIRLRDPADDRLRATFDANFLQAGLLLEGPITENQSFYLAGRRSYLDLLIEDQIEEDDGVRIVEFPKYDDYQGKYVWQLSADTTLRAQISGASDILAAEISEDAEDIETDPILAGAVFERSDFHAQGLVLESRFGQRGRLKSAIAHQTSSVEAQAGGAGALSVDNDNWHLKSHLMRSVNSRHDLTIGADFSQLTADVELDINDPGCTEFESACRLTGAERLAVNETVQVNLLHAFVKDIWYVSDRLTLYPGLSLQAEDYTDTQFVEPRLAMEYSARDDLILSAGLGIYHQMPEFGQINEVLGNPDLDHITATHAVLGVEKSYSDKWQLKTEVYYKAFDNLVAGDDLLRYNNDGEGYAYGLDALIRKELTDKWSGWLSLSLSNAQREQTQTGSSFPFDYDQPVNATLVANYKASPKWNFGSKLWMHSGAPFTPITGASENADNPGLFDPEYGGINSERLPMFSRLDVRVDRIFQQRANKQISVYTEILNVFDNKNVSGYDYNRDYSERTSVAQLPRILSLGIKATF
ncbi:MAG: TonB-dependent receptor [Granulosicoccus sp.]